MPDEALRNYTKALAIRERELGADAELTAHVRSALPRVRQDPLDVQKATPHATVACG